MLCNPRLMLLLQVQSWSPSIIHRNLMSSFPFMPSSCCQRLLLIDNSDVHTTLVAYDNCFLQNLYFLSFLVISWLLSGFLYLQLVSSLFRVPEQVPLSLPYLKASTYAVSAKNFASILSEPPFVDGSLLLSDKLYPQSATILLYVFDAVDIRSVSE